ncbi:MAG: MerR family transcriptional regulator [Actinomycetota bacterium]|nr:MAG: MerR family transcriptional regulator [Actinomycetota bacterium]
MTTSNVDTPLSRIGVVAERIGISERTLRYYEEFGLVTPSAYSRGGARLYDEDVINRVSHIRNLQSLMGFNLEEIKDILSVEDHLDQIRIEYRSGSKPKKELLSAAINILNDLQAKVRDKQVGLQNFQNELEARLTRIHNALDETDS